MGARGARAPQPGRDLALLRPRRAAPASARLCAPGRGRAAEARREGGWRRQRGRAASGFVLEPVAGAAAGGPGHVMPGPGGGQAGIQWQPAGAAGAGAARAAGAASRLRERARGSAPSALAPASRPPGVASLGESLPGSGRRRRRRRGPGRVPDALGQGAGCSASPGFRRLWGP